MTIYTVYWLRDNTHTNPHTEGYIGITSRDPSLRLEEHLKSKDYIPDTYVFDILHQVDTPEEMCSIEESYRPQSHIGWNLAKGGVRGGRPEGIHTSGWTHSEESKQKRSEMFSGENNPQFGKPTSDAQKRAVSKALLGRKKWYKVADNTPPPMYGKDNGMSRRVVVGDEVYDTVTEAAKSHNVSRVTATRRLRVDTFPDWNYE